VIVGCVLVRGLLLAAKHLVLAAMQPSIWHERAMSKASSGGSLPPSHGWADCVPARLQDGAGRHRVKAVGRSPDWLKFKNPEAPAVKREAEEEWGK
jgi:hypothetical protein